MYPELPSLLCVLFLSWYTDIRLKIAPPTAYLHALILSFVEFLKICFIFVTHFNGQPATHSSFAFLNTTRGAFKSSPCIHLKVQCYLWLVSFPGTRSPDGSIGEGSRFRQEARDWLESSLDTIHRTKQHTSQVPNSLLKSACDRVKQWRHYLGVWNKIFPFLMAHLREQCWKSLEPTLVIKPRFGISSCLYKGSEALSSLSDSTGQESQMEQEHRGLKMITAGYKLHWNCPLFNKDLNKPPEGSK